MDERQILLFLLANEFRKQKVAVCIMVVVILHHIIASFHEKYVLKNRTFARHQTRLQTLEDMIGNGDIECVNQLRMDKRTFGLLCELLRSDGRLKMDSVVSVDEQVCMFLHVLAHHVKNRTINNRFKRSGETISRFFNSVLNGVLRLQHILLKSPEPVPEHCTDGRWKFFKNCLGALDGTYIKVRVPEVDKPRYRTRKGEIATNVLGACSQDMMFIFVLPGWEGSASDSRVLQDAISRENGLKVPTGCYYLVDAGYTNGEGFLAPYRGTRYHLSEWKDGCAPVNYQEYFNMKHASARNVIERCFGLLKMRWAILRSPSFYPLKTQCRIITACCLLHNLIRKEMSADLMECEIDDFNLSSNSEDHEAISQVSASEQWTAWRDNLALQMFNDWRRNRGI